MNLHWLRDKELTKQLKICWEKGQDNNSDYFTKNHYITHHRKMRPFYVRDAIDEMHILFQKYKNLYNVKK